MPATKLYNKNITPQYPGNTKDENLLGLVAGASIHKHRPDKAVATNGRQISMLAELDRLLVNEVGMECSEMAILVVEPLKFDSNRVLQDSHVAGIIANFDQNMAQTEIEDDWILVENAADFQEVGAWTAN